MAKMVIYIGITIGGIVGGYVPVVLFNSGWFSVASILCGFIGCIAGAWLGWKLAEWVES